LPISEGGYKMHWHETYKNKIFKIILTKFSILWMKIEILKSQIMLFEKLLNYIYIKKKFSSKKFQHSSHYEF